MRKKIDILYLYLFLLLFMFDFLKIGFIRYILALLFLIIFINNKIVIEKKKLVLLLPSLLMMFSILNCIFNSRFDFYSIKDLLFYLAPISITIILSSVKNDRFIKNDFFIEKSFNIMNLFSFIKILELLFITKEFSLYESADAFVYTLFFAYYLNSKKYYRMSISFLLILFYQKRIAIIAVVLNIVLYLIFYIYDCLNKRVKVLLVIVIFLIVSIIYIYYIKTGMLTEILIKNNIIDMGRTNAWSRLSNQYDISFFYVGKGIGYCTRQVSSFGYDKMGLLHNDILKIYIELGFVGYLLYFVSIFYPLRYTVDTVKKRVLLANILTLVFIYFTDNISIYFLCLIIYYFISLSCINVRKEGIKHV